jgi:hypothetical protein
MAIRLIVDLRDRFGDIRDQSPRPTCMAFAASDAHAFARNSKDPLSVEYAFFHAVKRMPKPNPRKGVPFKIMSETIAVDGQPLEHVWPYQNKHVALAKWQPPPTLGPIFRRPSNGIPLGISTVCTQLDAGKPVMVVMDISETFYRVTAAAEVLMAPVTEQRINTHAVLAAGYGDHSGTRCILIRNSWGTEWFHAGYGWIDHRYMEPRMRDLGIMV